MQGQNTNSAPTASDHDSEGQPDAGTTELRSKTFTDAQKLVTVLKQAEAFRQSFQSETASAQAAAHLGQQTTERLQQLLTSCAAEHKHVVEQKASLAQTNKETRALNPQTQQNIQELHKATAEARAERDRLEEQQASAVQAVSETKALSQQIQQDLQALRKAAAEAKAERQALLAQATASQAIKAEAQAAIERARQTSDKLDVDVEAARQSLQSDKARLQTARREALDACAKLQVSISYSSSQLTTHASPP
jgi:colicin import membrane protein